VILGGEKSDLVTVAENVRRPIIYNTSWTSAILVKPREIPGFSPSYFNITGELTSKDNFRKKKYLILEDDIDLWRNRLEGVGDSLFSISSQALLHYTDYSVKLYKFNTFLNKGVYELKLKEM